MTTSHVLAPDEPLPDTVIYDVSIVPDLLKLSPAAQNEVDVIISHLLAIFHIRDNRNVINFKAMMVNTLQRASVASSDAAS